MHSNQLEENQRGAEVYMHLLHISCPVFHFFVFSAEKSFYGTDCCSLAVTIGAGMDLHPIVLHAPLTTHHTLEACLRSLRNSPPAATDLNLQAAKELQAKLAKYIATCSAAAAASKKAPRKRRQDKPGLFSLTKCDLVLVMGFLERVSCQAIVPFFRATKDVVAQPPALLPPLRAHWGSLSVLLFVSFVKWHVDLLAWVHHGRYVKPRCPISKKDLLALTDLCVFPSFFKIFLRNLSDTLSPLFPWLVCNVKEDACFLYVRQSDTVTCFLYVLTLRSHPGWIGPIGEFEAAAVEW